MQRKFLFWSIVTALGGFLFGFDTAVILGAKKAIQQRRWHLSAVGQGFTSSLALIGAVPGAMLGGILSDRLGRRQALRWTAALYLVVQQLVFVQRFMPDKGTSPDGMEKTLVMH